jgi:hypothetical protein
MNYVEYQSLYRVPQKAVVFLLFQQSLYHHHRLHLLLLDYRPTRAAVLSEQTAVPVHPTPMRY